MTTTHQVITVKTMQQILKKLNQIIQEEEISAEVRTYLIEIAALISNLEQRTESLSNAEILLWLQKQKYQTEQGEQEYKMYFDVDMPKIIRAAIVHFNN